MTSDSTELKIIEAAIECVEVFGLKGATNRRIAEKAGVNLAAINYYFRSKENLIERVMQTTLHNAFDWEDFNKLPGDSAKERCVNIFLDLIDGGCKYPGMTRAHFYDLLAEGNYDSLSVKKYNEFLAKLVDDVHQRGTSLSIEELRLALSQIASACMLGILAPRMHHPSLGVDLLDEKDRHQFVSEMVNKLL